MAKVWVLDTETKGTGANMVPLERTVKRGSEAAPGFGFRNPEAPTEPSPEPRKPLEFRVIDIMTREVLAERADARSVVKTLSDVRSIVDVTIDVWDRERERWRMLTFGEKRALWEYRDSTEELGPAHTSRARA